MNLPIVDFQTAKDIKELGFDWPVYNIYRNNESKRLHGLSQIPMDVNSQKTSAISAPTQAETVRWMRVEKNISVIVEWYGAPGQIEFEYEVCSFVDVSIMEVGYHYNTYEQAELAGIKKAIEILKNK
jgi:hypothetical protein